MIDQRRCAISTAGFCAPASGCSLARRATRSNAHGVALTHPRVVGPPEMDAAPRHALGDARAAVATDT
jgi:hypothetical protein